MDISGCVYICKYVYVCTYVYSLHVSFAGICIYTYGVATIGRLLKIISLFCQIVL